MESVRGNRFLDITNIRFGKLIAIKEVGKNKSNQYMWECLCDCGKKSIVSSSNLVRNNTKSCGCFGDSYLANKTRTHGMSSTRMFKIWVGIRKRCTNKKCIAFKDYGGRGIKVCERWQDFNNFYLDMKNSYSDKLTLDRIDTNGDYEPSNCRWATNKMQSNNRRNNVFINLNGVVKTVSEWADLSGVSSKRISHRVKNGWDAYDAIYKKSITSNMASISKYLIV